MEYINKVTSEVSTLNEVKRQHNASIPAGQAYGDWMPVLQGDPPEAPEGLHVERDGIEERDGQFYMSWKLVPSDPLPV